MKNIVIIAPDFTPSSYPPALRARFFAQHLREFGWDPIVLTTHPENYEWSVDPENDKLLDSSLVEVIRTGAWSITWTRKLGFGDLSLRTLWPHWRALNRICRERKVDLILISVPPRWPIALGRLAHMRFGIPYILDYNDPILTDYYWKVPHSKRPPKWELVYAMHRFLEPFALKKVDQVIGVDNSYIAGLFKRYEWLNVKATPVAFGVEPADFEYVRQNRRPNPLFTPADGLFHMSYVGRGGPDMVPSLRAFFTAVQARREKSPEMYRRLRLHFVGTTYAPKAELQYQVLPVARECGVDDIVEEQPGRVSHLDAIQILLDSDALLLLGSEAPHYTASKIFPYILAAKPLFAMFHEQSSAVKLLEQTCAGTAVTFSEVRPPLSVVGDIEAALDALLSAPSGSKPATDWEKFEPFTARSVTARLAEVLNQGSAHRACQ